MYFRQFYHLRDYRFIRWMVDELGRKDTGFAKDYGRGWSINSNGNKNSFKLEIIF